MTQLTNTSDDAQDGLQTLFKNLPGMAYRCVNLDHWPMSFVSEGCEALCGYTSQQLETQQVLWGDFTHRHDVAEVDRQVKSAARKGQPFEVEYRIVPRTGPHKWVWERGRVVDWLDDGTAVLEGFITDITSLRDAQRTVSDQRAQLAHVERLNTLGEMTAAIAHEINQPLTAIAMYSKSAQLLAQQGNQKQLQEVLEKLAQQSLRAGAVIERMQAMSYQSSHQQDHIDPINLLKEIKDLAEIEAQVHSYTIELQLPHELPSISCDPIQIQQVILNLLRNGMQAMQVNLCSAGSAIVLAAKVVDEQLWIHVRDQGTGIETAMADKLFLAFASNKHTDKAAGMGLGLTIGKAIIEAHGGRLNYSNLRPNGAEFSFNLALPSKHA
ncbi:MAG: PAS domain-containing sensor histidine kinase [Oceanospirillaceae bacterium]|nr:PAS domain-containing sensor histidine kinase [Oceanospirillaceae bacterium]MBT4442542.1 PAS domain-containing sensor histidine kinase [Oceanospirillaceae bacterium]MBT6077647.1 PAS domain-containing sensor histidine kinase [Oceanospirillaceae bacterium]MBT7330449.1 PAS domain-containing sensor histidine kinase [Oceanospirillaceae bacterium]